VDLGASGAKNLAGFVRATAGRRGTSADISGGVAIAGPVAVVHGYVDAAIPTDVAAPAAAFFDDAISFFESVGRPFVVWVPSSATSHLTEAASRGLTSAHDPSPAMVASGPVGRSERVRIEVADHDDWFDVIGDLCERGYQQPGMAWLMSRQQSCHASNSCWYVAFDGDVPVSTACGFRTGDTGGIYSVATPPEFRGRGFAAAVTGAATNRLFELGVARVVLQASKLGFGVYERLGFTTYDHYERFAVSTVTPPR
jgi:ribosomal protein S18 acetylase RimI-like enzyme